MAKTLYLMRHGRTMFNEKHLIQGWCDSPLSELGHRQAEGAARLLRARGVEFDYACCSDTVRAAETLEHVTAMPFDRLRGLRELFFGELEGESTDLVSGPGIESFEQRCRVIRAAGGESYEHLRERAVGTLRQVMDDPARACVLAVAHGDLMRQCYAAWSGASAARYEEPMQNCCIFVCSYDDGSFRIEEIVNENLADAAGAGA